MSEPVAPERPRAIRQTQPERGNLCCTPSSYHVEEEVTSWTPQEDASLMDDLNRVHDRLTLEGRLGPAARLGATKGACVLRGKGKGVVTDGPFTETKEQLLGFYVIDCADRDAAIAAARDLRQVNPSAMYEIRPVLV
jgi:hypothetical protein